MLQLLDFPQVRLEPHEQQVNCSFKLILFLTMGHDTFEEGEDLHPFLPPRFLQQNTDGVLLEIVVEEDGEFAEDVEHAAVANALHFRVPVLIEVVLHWPVVIGVGAVHQLYHEFAPLPKANRDLLPDRLVLQQQLIVEHLQKQQDLPIDQLPLLPSSSAHQSPVDCGFCLQALERLGEEGFDVGVADVSFVEDGEQQAHDVAGIFSIEPAIISAEGALVSATLRRLLVVDEIADVLLEGCDLLQADRLPPSAPILAQAIHYMINSYFHSQIVNALLSLAELSFFIWGWSSRRQGRHQQVENYQ